MEVAFWAAAAVVLYTYVGYLGILYLRCLFVSKTIESADHSPALTIVMAMRNEAVNVEKKFANLAALDYPRDRVQVMVVSDGSTDGTNGLLQAHTDVHSLLLEQHVGKAEALNRALSVVQYELVVFTDARQTLEPESLKFLVSNFADPTVGCVSGELMLRDEQSGNVQSLGLYWKIEKWIRALESRSGSVVGVTGSFYAARRALIPVLPAGLLLDDVYVPMHVVKSGYRVVFEPRARAWDVPVADAALEFRRKVRTLTGNYQLVRLCPWLLGPGNPLWFEFVCHKLLRLIAPFLLFVILILPALLPGLLYKALLAIQASFYLIGLLSLTGLKMGPLRRLADVSSSFIVLNSAAAVALFNTIIGREAVWGA